MGEFWVLLCASEVICATALLGCALREELLPLAFRDHYPKRSIKFVESAGWWSLTTCDSYCFGYAESKNAVAETKLRGRNQIKIFHP